MQKHHPQFCVLFLSISCHSFFCLFSDFPPNLLSRFHHVFIQLNQLRFLLEFDRWACFVKSMSSPLSSENRCCQPILDKTIDLDFLEFGNLCWKTGYYFSALSHGWRKALLQWKLWKKVFMTILFPLITISIRTWTNIIRSASILSHGNKLITYVIWRVTFAVLYVQIFM